ncbi:MAG: DUF4214 domain-containing protein [bacterium]|nr:DUF4214 domain-containing protein [bacterium]
MDFDEGSSPTNGASAPLEAADLLNFYDEQFVLEAYRRLLNRKPDTQGHAYYLNLVRSGTSRYEVIYNITSSQEFYFRKIPLSGLKGYKIFRWLTQIPVLGHCVKVMIFLFRIEAFMQDIRALENHVYRLSVAQDRNAGK